jgi:hypothetical protein
MDSTAYKKIKDAHDSQEIPDVKINLINAALKDAGYADADIGEVMFATKLADKVLKGATIKVTFDADKGNAATVTIGDIGRTHVRFALAFVSVFLASIEAAAMDKFLPEPKQPKTASGNKRDGAGSPSATRILPVRGGNY